jgi:hypothetical protein
MIHRFLGDYYPNTILSTFNFGVEAYLQYSSSTS